MPTDIAGFRAKLIEERAVVLQLQAFIDLPAEEARMEAARVEKDAALRKFAKAQTRYNLATGVGQRLAVLNNEIDILTANGA